MDFSAAQRPGVMTTASPLCTRLILPGMTVACMRLGENNTEPSALHAHLGQQLPSPADGFLLEVVAKGPVAQHLKEGVVVHVLADIVQVIVLTTYNTHSTAAMFRHNDALLHERPLLPAVGTSHGCSCCCCCCSCHCSSKHPKLMCHFKSSYQCPSSTSLPPMMLVMQSLS